MIDSFQLENSDILEETHYTQKPTRPIFSPFSIYPRAARKHFERNPGGFL